MFGEVPEGIEVLPATIGSLPAEWVIPLGARKDKVIFYNHGGGYVSGSFSNHRIHLIELVQGSGIRALQFENRLAPEYPYPAVIDDSLAAYRWLLAQGVSASNIIIAGESAGGGLCLATLLALRDQNIPLPAAVVAISPCLLWILPFFGKLHGLPPILIYVGEDEIHLDDSIRFAKEAKAAGVDIALRIGDGMIHCYPFLPPFIPESRQAMDEICSFIKTHIDRPIN